MEQNNQPDIAEQIISQKLWFDSLSAEVISQLLRERQLIRNNNHNEIMGRITDISGEISCCDNQPYSFEARERRVQLIKIKEDLEKQLLAEDVTLWRDTEELRQILVRAMQRKQSGELRSNLFPNENKPVKDRLDSKYMQGS